MTSDEANIFLGRAICDALKKSQIPWMGTGIPLVRDADLQDVLIDSTFDMISVARMVWDSLGQFYDVPPREQPYPPSPA